jgi:putative ABC transport system permease protein
VETALDASVSQDARRAAILFLGSIGLVLLIACANVANLLMARGVSRSREIAIRAAVGANRGRIVGQLMIEHLLLAGLGGVGGVALATGGLAWLRRMFGVNLLGEVPPFEFSARVLYYALFVALAAAIVFGLLPAFRAVGLDVIGTLREGGRGETTSRRFGKLRGALVATEMALSVVLLVSAGLTLKASHTMSQVDLGIEPRQGIVFSTVLQGPQFSDTTSRAAFQERLAARLRAIPGVDAAGFGSELPLDGSSSSKYAIEGEDSVAYTKLPGAQYHLAGPGYFEAVGIRLQRGRFFTQEDRRSGPLVALVNDALAKRHWPSSESPIGRRIRFWDRNYEIVGVVASIHEWGVQNGAPAAIYLPASQVPVSWNSFVVSSSRDIRDLTTEVTRAVAVEAPGHPFFRVMPLADYRARGYREPRILAFMLTLMAAVALALATLGIASVVAYSVAQRTRELGIRRALGANAKQIVATVARQNGKAVGIGAAVGLALALATSRLVAGFLNGASPLDPLIFGTVFAVLIVAAATAMAVPTWRAVRVAPLVALRND